MRGFIRHLVMWLLALALPLQGAAAATGLHCAHARSAMTAPAPAAHDLAHEAVHAAPAHAAHHHGGSATSAHPHPTSTPSDTLSSAHDAGDASASQQGCSACASCCPAVAMPVAALVVSGHPKVESAPPAVSDVNVVFLTGGPERPPRRFLA